MNFDLLYDKSGVNNLSIESTHQRNFVQAEAWMPAFLESINIKHTNVSPNKFYPIELRLYSPTWEVDLDIGRFKDVDNSTIFLIWHPRQGYMLDLSENNIFEQLHNKFPNNQIRFTFGSVNRPYNLPIFVDYYHFDYFQWHTTSNIPKLEIDKNKTSATDFLFLNGRFRPQRSILYYDLLSNGLLDHAKSTFCGHTVYNATYEYMMNWMHVDSTDVDLRFFENFKSPNFFNWLNTIKNDISREKVLQNTMYDDTLYNDIYLDLVTETFFDARPNLFITEKTYRAIANGCIFLICGQKGTLAYLKSQGFETFDDLFDESYDTLNSWSERWRIIKNNLITWQSMSLHDRQAYYQKSFDKLVHNQDLLYNKNHRDDVLKIFTC